MVGMDTPDNLVASVADKVKELPCAPGDLNGMQSQYKVCNVYQRQGETWVRVVGDKLPNGGQYVKDHLTLEDVYLYYLGE